jgi:hypothetical protein
MKAFKPSLKEGKPMSSDGWLQEVHRIVEDNVAGNLIWHREYADCKCPLDHDARVYINRAWPFLHCLHEQCERQVRDINDAMREAAAWLPDSPLKQLVKATPAPLGGLCP